MSLRVLYHDGLYGMVVCIRATLFWCLGCNCEVEPALGVLGECWKASGALAAHPSTAVQMFARPRPLSPFCGVGNHYQPIDLVTLPLLPSRRISAKKPVSKPLKCTSEAFVGVP